MSYVFVLDTTKRPLDPVHPGWARKLLSTGQAAVWRHYPFTKYHRVSRRLEKTHWLDAACVGKSTPECLQTRGVSPLHIKATGSGNRQLCGTDKYGFPIRHRARQKHVYEFQTGDMVRVLVPSGKNVGVHTGRMLVRATGSFDISTKGGRIQRISHRCCTVLHQCDGYRYEKGGCHASLA